MGSNLNDYHRSILKTSHSQHDLWQGYPKKLNFAHNITDPIKSHKITKHNYRIWSVMSPTRNQRIARENQKDQQPPLLCFFQERVIVHSPTLNLFLGPRVSLKLQDALAPQFKALGDQKWESLPCPNSHKIKQSLFSFVLQPRPQLWFSI